MEEYTDNDYMLFGKHSGKQLKDVPANYLLYLYRVLYKKPRLNKTEQKLYNYILNNKEVLEKENNQPRRDMDWGDFHT